ncbi:MAG: hypothetical protein BWY04_01388 [candidate division CPR1 bacterium ADurb.Bin160]|uniref:Uncharacterized protein n=1 Tax=candidate division CPR1 bacterium ADurb.Bin160 TaxID=1852826 RepID=A0A1V5ZJH1_9BACT|nr:MAG: hypothetical protein BWY04_01388 [candidate division CPR1 bacterium ADurb.Bin160]
MLLNSKELDIIFFYLEEATQNYKNHGCVDINEKIFEHWSDMEKKKI